MKLRNAHILIVALAAGVLGALTSLWFGAGQRLLPAAMDASAPEPPPGVKPAIPGEPMPPLKLADLQGRMRSLPDAYPGRRLLINVWASWCGPCIEEMPELDRFARSQGKQGVQVIGLALDTPENIQEFLRRVPVAYPILVDRPDPADASVWLGNRKGVLPYSVLVGIDGRVLKQKVGPFAADELNGWARP